MSSTDLSPVRRRRVFYIPGYDPFPPRRYRELYRTQAAEQAGISGYEIAVGPQQSGDGFGWHVKGHIEGQVIDADIEVLVWSDIVQSSRPPSILQTYLDLLRTAWIYISTGALFRLMRLRKGPVIAALYPVVALTGQAILAALIVYVPVRGADFVPLPMSGPLVDAIRTTVGTLLGMWLAWQLLRWFQTHDNRFFAYYLMHDFAYSAAGYGAYAPELETRLAAFGKTIASALEDDVDEVLVVGHSSGAHLGISILADLLRAGDLRNKRPALAFLSLGHVVPMVSFLPKADRLRGDLRLLSTTTDITWVDVTAPGDGCCFALCDPVAISGQATPEKRAPLVFSAAFTQSLSAEKQKALRWRFFRLHFQYLCAFDRPKDYDYFQITAGALSLADRYKGRAPSKSRLERSMSKHTSVRP